MSKFVPQSRSSQPGVAKFVAGAGVPIPMPLEKVGGGERELGLSGQVRHVTGDGVIHDLVRLLNNYYMSLPKDPRLMTANEKEELLASIRAALQREGVDVSDGSYGAGLALRLAGITTLDGQIDSRRSEAHGAAKAQADQKENGGYRVPRQPADRPSSIAKSSSADMAALRQQILALRDRIAALVERQERR